MITLVLELRFYFAKKNRQDEDALSVMQFRTKFILELL